MTIPTTAAIVPLDSIRQAAQRIKHIARLTPLMDVSAAAGRPFLLKCENLQPAGAFKIRGAYNMVAQLTDDESLRTRPAITARRSPSRRASSGRRPSS
jgi:threonine dehydratase